MKKILCTLLSALAISTAASADMNPYLQVPAIDKMVMVPARAFAMVKDEKSGMMVLASENGRYLITGFQMRDTWHDNVLIESPEQLSELANRMKPTLLPLDQMMVVDINVPKKKKLRKAAAAKVLTAFVDPNCGYCHQLFTWLQENPSYQARLIVVPILGDDSVKKSQQISCALQDKKTAALVGPALLSGNYSKMPDTSACTNHEKLRNNVITANAVGAYGVPYLVAADGRFFKGLPPDFAAFINDKLPQTQVGSAKAAPKAPKS